MTYITGEDKPPLDEALLEHYGVMGMKWGVRRTQAHLDRAAGRVRKSAKQQVDFYKPAGRAAKKAGKAVGRATAKSAKQQVDFYKPAGKLIKKGASAAGQVIAKSAKQQVDFYKPAGRVVKKGAGAAGNVIAKSGKQQIDFYKRDK